MRKFGIDSLRNVALAGHGGAGKTSLVEALPFQAGAINRLGTIEAGKRADMVVLNANPLEAVANIRRVRWAISDGRVYDAPALWRAGRF